MTTVLGLDIGGTHSRARLAHDGQPPADATAASASYTAAGASAAEHALDALLNQLGVAEAAPLDAICAGTAGAEAGHTRAALTEKLGPLTRPDRLLVVSDARLPLPAAGLDEGIGLIAGTGSVALGVHADAEYRAGGWGYLLGDEGSGYWITRRAIRELLTRHERGTAGRTSSRDTRLSGRLRSSPASRASMLARPYVSSSMTTGSWKLM